MLLFALDVLSISMKLFTKPIENYDEKHWKKEREKKTLEDYATAGIAQTQASSQCPAGRCIDRPILV